MKLTNTEKRVLGFGIAIGLLSVAWLIWAIGAYLRQ